MLPKLETKQVFFSSKLSECTMFYSSCKLFLYKTYTNSRKLLNNLIFALYMFRNVTRHHKLSKVYCLVPLYGWNILYLRGSGLSSDSKIERKEKMTFGSI